MNQCKVEEEMHSCFNFSWKYIGELLARLAS
jgi:hypothetical protein